MCKAIHSFNSMILIRTISIISSMKWNTRSIRHGAIHATIGHGVTNTQRKPPRHITTLTLWRRLCRLLPGRNTQWRRHRGLIILGLKYYYFDEETLDKTRLSNHLKQTDSRKRGEHHRWRTNIISDINILYNSLIVVKLICYMMKIHRIR